MYLKRPKSMCAGPSCKGCSSADCYSGGGRVRRPNTGPLFNPEGLKGVHTGYSDRPAGESSIRGNMTGAAEDKIASRINGKAAINRRRDENAEIGRGIPEAHKFADGGRVGEPTPEPDNLDQVGKDDMDSELHDMLGSEILGAIEAKDSKMIWSGIEALVLSIMNKGNDE